MAVINRTKEPEQADSAPAEETATAEESTRVQEPTHADEAARVEEPPRAAEPSLAAEPSRVEEPTRVREPTPIIPTTARGRAALAGAGAARRVARAIWMVTGVVVGLIALGIAFTALHASPTNTIVSHVHSWASWLVTPFHGMFHVRGARGTLALNWGLALVVYVALVWLLTRLLLAPWRAIRRRRRAAVDAL
jgi:hypothetical protein